ncbi:MAG TPA: peptidase S41 [Phycisphaerales bacterium]|nr:peptidase S41 [Phycisphaerales bacterium]
MHKSFVIVGAAILALAPVASARQQGVRPDAAMLQFPDVSAEHIVFVYANDLWTVPRAGGVASPLAGPAGRETFPKFSPDGRTIAFVANYEGDRDVYTIPTGGGLATRVTHHPASEVVTDWTPDGRIIFYSSGHAGLQRQEKLFAVAPAGGMAEPFPVPYGTTGAVSSDGAWLAYTPWTHDFRTWKRYRGGWATDIWLFNLKDRTSRKITDWEGTDTIPMWHGATVYYLSDSGPEHRQNIWAYDTRSGAREQVTSFKDYDIKWPSIGPGQNGNGEIVFQHGKELRLLDLRTKQSRAVEVIIPGDRPTLRPQQVDFAKALTNNISLSPGGKRLAAEARGDIWSLPAVEGASFNLTRTSDVAERDPQWSPDGKWIAFLSDESGEYEIYLMPSDGPKPGQRATRLTTDGASFRYMSAWSPDSRRLLFFDKAGSLFLHSLGGEAHDGSAPGTTKLIATDPWAERRMASWSHDSAWIAFPLNEDNRNGTIRLYEVATGTLTRVTDPMFNSTWPVFDRKGDWLYFTSNRRFAPTYSEIDNSWIYRDSDVLHAVPLRAGVKNPMLPRNDAEGADAAKKDEEKKKDEGDAANKDEPTSATPPKPPITIDLAGFEARAIPLAVDPGDFTGLSVNDSGKLLYLRNGPDDADLKLFDFLDEKADKKEEKTVASKVNGFQLSPDGKKALVRKGEKRFVVDAAPDQKLEKSVPTDAMTMDIDPRAEWAQVFQDAWRIFRDFFYEPGMHGVDWPAIGAQYRALLADCASRDDLTFVIAEMISELNVGHAYYRPGDQDTGPTRSVGMLGCDFMLDRSGAAPAYRIARIHRGADWDTDARGPLSQPGVDVKPGDFLLAVNGVPVDASKDPWAAFVGTADKVVTLTVSDKPLIDDGARTVTIKPLASESNLRFRGWIEENRRYVDYKSGGRIGYIYVINTGVPGQNDLVRQFYGQRDKAALIIDDRWNGGGQIPTRFIEVLNRPRTNYWARRDGKDWAWPPDSHQGPKAMLINGLSASGGDMFPALFRQSGLGKLFGTRTWGGLVGISGNPAFIDGTAPSVPTFGFYEVDGTWGIEGHGVDPDVEVLDDPARMPQGLPTGPEVPAMGGDPQLDTAIEHLMGEIQRNPYSPPAKPRGPDRKGMGIAPQDK